MHTFQPNLLRRTAMAFAAVAGLAVFSLPSSAAVITLSGASGNSCSYSTMSVAPDGSFTVSCTSGTTTPPPTGGGTDGGVFQFITATGTAGVAAHGFYGVTRSSGTGAVSMNYTVSGAGCTNGVGQLNWADGDTSAQSAIVYGIADGTCNIQLGTPTFSGGTQPSTAARLGTPTSMSVTVGTGGGSTGGGGGGGGGNTAGLDTTGCPAGYTPPADILQQTFLGVGNWFSVTAKSNQVTALKLPATQPGYASGMISMGESPIVSTPQPVTIYISINKCPGLIDTNTAEHCNVISGSGAQNNITWFQAPSLYAGVTDQASANARGYCWAPPPPAGSGTMYVNMKWTYNQCANFAASCGFTVLQNYGSY